MYAFSHSKESDPMTRIISIVAVLLAVGSFALDAMAQSRTWYVWINVSTSPATIGVADASYNVPGWTTLAGPFPTDRAAWVEACRLHYGPQYHSPDVAAGRVFC